MTKLEDTVPEKEKYGKYCSPFWHVFQKYIKQDRNTTRLHNNSEKSPLLLLTSSTGITMIKISPWMSVRALNMEGKCSGGVKVKWKNTTEKYRRKLKLSFQREENVKCCFYLIQTYNFSMQVF